MSQYVLRVYRAPSGQMAGTLYDGDNEVGGVAGCATVDEVVEAIEDAGHQLDAVLVVDGDGQTTRWR